MHIFDALFIILHLTHFPNVLRFCVAFFSFTRCLLYLFLFGQLLTRHICPISLCAMLAFMHRLKDAHTWLVNSSSFFFLSYSLYHSQDIFQIIDEEGEKKSIILNDWCLANFWSDIIFYSQAHSLSSPRPWKLCKVTKVATWNLEIWTSTQNPHQILKQRKKILFTSKGQPCMRDFIK